jgi:hypothetical protein
LEKSTPEPKFILWVVNVMFICLTTRNEGKLFGQIFDFIFEKTKENQIKG